MTYPFLDLCVLPVLRSHFVASHAALLFTHDLAEVLWTNSDGAELIGASSIRSALENDRQSNPAMMRQIAAAAEKLELGGESAGTMRMRGGFKTRLVGFNLHQVELPDRTPSLLLTTERLHPRHHSEVDMARAAVRALDGHGHASAILDGSGQIVAASPQFATLDIEQSILGELANEVVGENDRLIKRPIATSNGDLPAGIAFLNDETASSLLVIADPHENGESDVAETPGFSDAGVPTEPPESPDDVPAVRLFSNRREAPGSNSLGRWYLRSKPEADPDSLEPVSEELAEQAIVAAPSSDEARGADDAPPRKQGLVQTTKLHVSDAAPSVQQEEDSSPSPDRAERTDGEVDDGGFNFQFMAKPVRFVWEMDSDRQFGPISTELSQAVGPRSADVEGRNWEEVARTRGFENGDQITALLQKGDTWSGKTVLWPVEGTDLRVPVDLAGLPTYDKNRVFNGFSGFGIARTADAIVDPEALGLTFAVEDGAATDIDPTASRSDDKNTISDNGETEAERGSAAEAGNAEDAHPDDRSDSDQATENVVNLHELRQQRSLSRGEKEAFEEIAEQLNGEDVAAPESAGKDETSASVDDSKANGSEDAFIPSAFARAPKAPSDSEATPVSADASGSDSEVDTSILARLPIPVLVYRGTDLLFGNQAFFQTTGYNDLDRLASAGGIETLYGAVSVEPGEGNTHVYHCDGSRLNVQAHLQSVPWDNQRAMLLTLRRREGGSDEAGDDFDPTASSKKEPASPTVDNAIEPPLAPSAKAGDSVPGDAKAANRLPLFSGTETPPIGPDGPLEAFGGLEAEDLRGILDVAMDGVVILSDDGIVRALNRSAEALFDVRPEQIVGQTITRLLAPESRRAAMDYLSVVSSPGVGSILNDGREIIGRTEKGGLIPLFITIGKMEKTDACCAVVRDITQWKRAEEELLNAKAQAESASAQKSDFLAKISHEVRTPLNAIIGFSDLMIEERFGRIENDRYRGYLMDIKRSGNHVLELVNDLLDLSKIEAGKVELEFDACSLNDIVSETVALNQPEANKERVIIRTSLSAVVPKVVADPRSLRQIILNLVSNGIKFTKSGGQVIVSTVYDQSGEVVLRVRDTGVGMRKSDIVRALRPFQQIEATADSTLRGTGLGLPLTKALVEANRAHFHIESEPDEGTLVEIHFPSQRVLADR